MPSNANYVRDYKQEGVTAKKRGETGTGHNASDSIRHRDRRKLEKKIGRKLKKGETVDHKTPLKSGGGSSPKNLRVRSSKLQSQDGGKMGSSKGKANGARKGHKSRMTGALS